MRAAHALAAAAIGAGLGIQLFLSFLLAPAAFRLIERPTAVRLMEGIFPGYYAFGLATMALALVLIAVLCARHRSAARGLTVGLLALTVAGTVYAGHVLLPQARAARLRAQAAPAGDLSPLEFSRLHRRAVAVNIALFVVGAASLLVHVATPPPPDGAVADTSRAGSEATASKPG
jgi:hypothetical protein